MFVERMNEQKWVNDWIVPALPEFGPVTLDRHPHLSKSHCVHLYFEGPGLNDFCVNFLCAIRKYHRLDGLEQQKIIFSQSWRLDVWHEGIWQRPATVMVLGKALPCFFLTVVPGRPWHSLACSYVHHFNFCLRFHMASFPLLSVSLFL